MTLTLPETPAAATASFPYRQKTYDLLDTAGMTEALHEDGFALIPGVLSRDECAALREAIDRLRPFGFDHLGLTDHFKCVFNRDQLFLQMIDRPGVIDLAEATMGQECHIIGETAWRSHPGHNGWGPHTDRTFIELPEDIAADPRVRIPIYLCTAHFYLNDIDEAMAPTWVIPGSHKSGKALPFGSKDPDPVWQGRKLEPVVCQEGDVLFFRSDIWHTGSKNTTEDRTRYLLQVHYSHRWIAQQFSPYLRFQFNPEILDAATPRQRRLLGEHRGGAYD